MNPSETSAGGSSSRLASHGKRLLGAGLDAIFAVAIGSVLSRVVAKLTGHARTLTTQEAWMLVPMMAQWALIASRGQTVGKMLLRMRIVRTSGAKVDFLHGVVLRAWPVLAIQLGPALLSPSLKPLTGILYLVDVLFIFGAARRCVHDRIAGTRVIDVDVVPARETMGGSGSAVDASSLP